MNPKSSENTVSGSGPSAEKPEPESPKLVLPPLREGLPDNFGKTEPIAYLTPKVRKNPANECWQWMAASYGKQKGYGCSYGWHRKWRAHRLFYFLFVGDIPQGMIVMHKCDNPGCVNPSHLQVGTYSENTLDAIRKNRFKIPRFAKLTSEQVRQIRAESIDTTQLALASKYQVSQSHIWNIVHRRNWTNLEVNPEVTP